LEQIEDLETKGSEKFFSEFLFFFQLICQIRNTDGGLHKKIRSLKESENFDTQNPEHEKMMFDEDFILSPVAPFFDSRTPEEFGKNLPKNGDDNGAYNIARKGIITLERIKEWWELGEEKRSKLKTPDLFITNTEWDAFTTKSKKLISSLL
jgi:CRISPR-associated protein Cpf1